MDEFEKEYFQKLKDFAPSFNFDRHALAVSRLKRLVAVIVKLVEERKETFDLIVGAGNSGQFITYVVEETYRQLKQKPPVVLQIPINRFELDGIMPHDNSDLLLFVKKQIVSVV